MATVTAATRRSHTTTSPLLRSRLLPRWGAVFPGRGQHGAILFPGAPDPEGRDRQVTGAVKHRTRAISGFQRSASCNLAYLAVHMRVRPRPRACSC